MRMISTKVEIQTQVESTEGIEQVQSLPELADLINQSHLQIQRVSKICLTQARVAGQHLLSAKEKIQHGMWLQWLQKYCPNLSDRTARAYMQVARNWEKLSSELADSADLTIDGALKLLSGKIDVVEAEIVEEADVPPPPTVKRSSVKRSQVLPLVNDPPPQTKDAPSPFRIGSIVRVVQEGHEFCGKGVLVDDRIDGGEILLFRALQDGRPGHIYPNEKTPALEPAPENIGEVVQETINEMGFSDNLQLYLFKQFLADEKLIKRLSPKLRAKFLNMQAWMRKG